MLINWALEVFKWKILIKPHEPISFAQGSKAVLAGVTMSIFTPNRVGEFAGKIFFLQKADRIKALSSSIIGSFAQLCVTLFFGSIALCLFFLLSPYGDGYRTIASIVFFIIVLGIIVFYLWPNKLKRITTLFVRWREYVEVFSSYSRRTLLIILQLSVLRYMVFSIQFFILLKLFLVNVDPGYVFISIAATFLGITLVPTITITEIGVRGSAALLFFGQFSDNVSGIIMASFTLWLINIVVPALIGLPFIFNLTFFRKSE